METHRAQKLLSQTPNKFFWSGVRNPDLFGAQGRNPDLAKSGLGTHGQVRVKHLCLLQVRVTH